MNKTFKTVTLNCCVRTQNENCTIDHTSSFLPYRSCHYLLRIPLGLPWSCPMWSVSPTFRSLFCLAACWPFLWSARSAKPSGSTSTAMMPGTWISTVRVLTAHAAPLIPHILSHLSISAYFVVILSFLNAGMCCVVFMLPQLNYVSHYKWNMWQCGNKWIPC